MSIKTLSQWAKDNAYSYRGAYNRFKSGNLEQAYKTSTGRIVVSCDSTEQPIKTIVYARVSSNKQKNDLIRQAERMSEFCIKNGWIVDQVITEIASGLNDARPKLIKLLEQKDRIRIVSEHKDRLTRFGFNYLKILIHGEIVIADLHGSNKMVARYYGQRRGSKKVKEILEKL